MLSKTSIFGLCGLLLMGCALTPGKPDFNQLPVVTFGEIAPKDKEFILYFPASTPITTMVNIEGSLLQKPASDELTVKLTKDIYAYKNWISFDKTHWVNARDGVEIRTLIKIPGPQHPKPGIIQVKVNEKLQSEK